MKHGQVVYRNLDEKSNGLMNPNGTYGQDSPTLVLDCYQERLMLQSL